jgi:lysophospholipase L1-like esterase
MLDRMSLSLHSDSLSQGSRGACERSHRPKDLSAPCVLVLASLGLVIAGCGGAAIPSANQTVTTPTAPAAPAAPAGPKYTQVTNFGASITCGYYATPDGATGYIWSNHGYAGLFDSSLTGATAQNLCRAGDQAADTVRTWVMPNAVPTLGSKQMYTFLVGTNDVIYCGGDNGCLPNYINAMTAALAWVALPASDKVLGSSLTVSKAWTSDLNLGVATNTAGASLTFPVNQTVAGRTLYIAYRVFDAGKVNSGTATVQLDGNTVATLSTIVNTGHAIATHNGLSDTIFAVAIPLGAAGAHNITITNGPNGGFFSFQWAGVSSGQYASTAGAPRVMAATLPTTTNTSYNSLEATQNDALNQLAAALASDGMWVTVVHCESVLDVTKDMYDNIHPNDSGHAKLAAAFESAL